MVPEKAWLSPPPDALLSFQGGWGELSGETWGRPGTTLTQGPRNPTVVGLPLLLLGAGVGAQELGEGAVPSQQLLVGAHLGDLAATHDDDEVHLGQVADAVRDQEPRLQGGRRTATLAHARKREFCPHPPPHTCTCAWDVGTQKHCNLQAEIWGWGGRGGAGRSEGKQRSLLQILGSRPI